MSQIRALRHEIKGLIDILGNAATLLKIGVESEKVVERLEGAVANALNRLADIEEYTQMPTRKLRILLVDDEPINTDVWRHYLEKHGHEVVGTAIDGPEMIGMAGRLKPDMIIYDIGLPGMNGFEAMRTIMRFHVCCGLPITGQDSVLEVNQALDDIAFGYIQKPLDRDHGEKQLMGQVGVAWMRFSQYRESITRANTAEVALEERKVIERAKGMVQRYYGWDEQNAFGKMQRYAKSKAMKLAEVARLIVSGAAVPLDLVPDREAG